MKKQVPDYKTSITDKHHKMFIDNHKDICEFIISHEKKKETIAIKGLIGIRRYLNSDKFKNNTMVNKDEILLIIQDIFNDLDSGN